MKNASLLLPVFLVVLLVLAWWLLRPTEITGTRQTGVTSHGAYILALTWQPAFCERAQNRPECRSQRDGRFDTRNFSLHGLWPQPRGNSYCGVPADLERADRAGKWLSLPKLDLTEDLRRELAVKMPGYRSGLHRHEWFKHGTCMPGYTPQSYFRVSLDLLDAFNRTAPARIFRENTGSRYRAGEILAAFDRGFGRGAGRRVLIECSRDEGRRLIRELRLSIAGNLGDMPDLAGILLAGKRVPRSCPGGIIDPPGLQ